jgi:hypothetical protein
MSNNFSRQVSELRTTLQDAITRLETSVPGPDKTPWGKLREQTRVALVAKAAEAIGDHLFWLNRTSLEQDGVSESQQDADPPPALSGLLDEIREAVKNGIAEPNPGFERVLWSLEGRLRDEVDAASSIEQVKQQVFRQLGRDQSDPSDYLDELRGILADEPLASANHVDPHELLIRRKQALAKSFRHDRAKAARRHELLWWTALVLWITVPAFAVLVTTVDPGAENISLSDTAAALAAGAFGGSLSSMRTLRDSLERLAQMDSFRAALWAQLAAAAGLGLIALILFAAGVLPQIGEAPAWDILIYSFLAGFSEPFAIQAVSKAVGVGS